MWGVGCPAKAMQKKVFPTIARESMHSDSIFRPPHQNTMKFLTSSEFQEVPQAYWVSFLSRSPPSSGPERGQFNSTKSGTIGGGNALLVCKSSCLPPIVGSMSRS